MINASPTVTVAGTGTAGDSYVLTSLGGADGSETIVNGSPTVTVTGTGTGADPYVLTSADTSDGSETVINASPTVTVAGTGTAGDPYVLTSLGGADGSETIIDDSGTITVAGTGTAGDPYILTVTGAIVTAVSPLTGDGRVGTPLGIANGGITAPLIADGAISGGAGGAIVDGSITASDLDADSVDASEIRIDAVGQSEIEDNAVGSGEIINEAVTPAKIQPGAQDQILRTNGGAVEWYTPVTNPLKANLTSFSAIRRVSDPKVALAENDHTVILEATVNQLSLPGAVANTGQILVIKDLGGAATTLNIPYIDYDGNPVFTTLNGGVIWLQSDGTDWQLIK